MKPTWQFLVQNPAHFVALGCGSGLAPKAPGTFGTLFAWGTFYALNLMPAVAFWTWILVAAFAGVWCMDKAGKALGDCDHGSIVWDEIVPFWALLMLVPFDFACHAAAFVLFRIYDIFKPWPASFFDEKVKNAFGVLMDDVIAAAFAGVTLHAALIIIFYFTRASTINGFFL